MELIHDHWDFLRSLLCFLLFRFYPHLQVEERQFSVLVFRRVIHFKLYWWVVVVSYLFYQHHCPFVITGSFILSDRSLIHMRFTVLVSHSKRSNISVRGTDDLELGLYLALTTSSEVLTTMGITYLSFFPTRPHSSPARFFSPPLTESLEQATTRSINE